MQKPGIASVRPWFCSAGRRALFSLRVEHVWSPDGRKLEAMRRLLRYLPPAFLVPFCLIGDAGAAAAVLNRYTGSYVGSGTILEGPNANSHEVSCSFTASPQGETGLTLRGSCSAYLIITRSVAVDLDWNPQTGRVTGTYTGARVGMAQLTGRQIGGDFDLRISWPKPLYGDTTAELSVATVDPDRFRIVVMDRIGPNGPFRATTNLMLSRR